MNAYVILYAGDEARNRLCIEALLPDQLPKNQVYHRRYLVQPSHPARPDGAHAE